MSSHQRAFLSLAIEHKVLRFGDFTLKSGRQSPYFFNLGNIATGAGLRQLASAYAQALVENEGEFDALFGPAYKGIPLVAAVATALAEQGHDYPFAYNRKEAKDHGEGGRMVGADLAGKRVALIDDVFTAGTAIRDSVGLLKSVGARPKLAITALDRQERTPSGTLTAEEISKELDVCLLSLVSVQDLLCYLDEQADRASTAAAIRQYLEQVGGANPS